jgi:ABC-type dipeptide/oligopeptide/nickel transport system ATPase subunit
MRPKSLDDLIGQDNNTNSLYNQFVSGRIPHFFIIHGQVGSGKTTLARILAMLIQTGSTDCTLTDEDWTKYKKYDIKEMNAANKNGIDDIRAIIEQMQYQPMKPSRAKIVIMDEAHQITSAAQNALLTETEDVADHVYYIFCTSAPAKIIPALQRRAYMISPVPFSKDDCLSLIKRAAEEASYDDTDEINRLHKALVDTGIPSPGVILQSCEKLFSGLPVDSCIVSMENSGMDVMPICRAVAAGNWKETAGLVKQITNSDIVGLKQAILGYLKAILLKSVGAKAFNIAKAIKAISDVENSLGCVPTFLATLCIACEYCKA